MSACVAALLGACIASAEAERPPNRRALIVGIDRYSPGEGQVVVTSARSFRNLEGAVNDAKAIEALLRVRYGFRDDEIRSFHDSDATREAILQGIEEFLVAGAGPDDLRVFYFSGHGSQFPTVAPDEFDARGETLVPVDAYRGAPDIRDKELRVAFNGILDAGADLVAIFDSCHSGSVARGYPARVRNPRYLEPGPAGQPSGDGSTDVPPEDRGALILAATPPGALAGEIEVGGMVWGNFTHALRESLAHSPATESVERLVARVRGRMRAAGTSQRPEIRATAVRRHKSLLGSTAGDSGAVVLIPAGETSADGRVTLLAGAGLGLDPGALLVAIDSSRVGVRLKVDEVTGLDRSYARRLTDDAPVQPGDLFRVEDWGGDLRYALRLHIEDSPFTHAEVDELAGRLAALAAEGVLLVGDPTEVPPSLALRSRGGEWEFVRSDGAVERLGRLTFDRLLEIVEARQREGTIFVDVPAPVSLLEALKSQLPRSATLVSQEDPLVHYKLVGRYVPNRVSEGGTPSGEVQYAWVAPGAGMEEIGLLPARTEWVPLRGEDADRGSRGAVSRLAEFAQRGAWLHRWLTLEAPVEEFPFPYRLVLHEGSVEVEPGATLRFGTTYQAVLRSTANDLAGAIADAGRRFVYLCHIGPDGLGSRLYPPPQADEVRLPDTDHPPPEEIPIPTTFPLRFVKPPGSETFLLLTSREKSRFDCLFERLKGPGAAHQSDDWHIERVSFRSVP